MSRFRRIDNEPVYSEIKPERCPLHAPVSERQAREARSAFMEEIPLPEELAADRLHSQLRGNK